MATNSQPICGKLIRERISFASMSKYAQGKNDQPFNLIKTLSPS